MGHTSKIVCAFLLILPINASVLDISPSETAPPASIFLRYHRINMVYTSPTKVARIVTFAKDGIPHSDIAKKLGVHRTTVGRIINRFDESGDFYYVRPKTGRPRVLEMRETRVAARILAKSDAANVTELQKKYFQHVGPQTLRRRLKEGGLVCRVRKAKPYLSPIAKERRRRWALEHASWTVEDWKKVVFSDESKFMLFKSDGRQYAWFRPGQAYDDRFVKKTVKHGGGKVMVWGCITGQGMGRLHKIDGIMCAPDYVKIMEEQFLGTLKDLKMRRTGNSGIIFQQDNDPKHTSKLARQWLWAHKVNLLSWPPSSPDMNIIEHVWDQLDRLIRARNPLPRNHGEMWKALQEEWAAFPADRLDDLFESMPERVAALVKARGGHTRY